MTPHPSGALRASFRTEHALLTAVREAKAAGLEVLDVFSPYPIHGLDEALELPPSRLPWVTFAAGLLGGSAALGFQIWTSTVGWALNVGGKPFLSLPAFIPVTFELTVLSAGLATAFAFFARSRLYPGRPAEALPGTTSDRFVLAVAASGGDGALQALRALGGEVES